MATIKDTIDMCKIGNVQQAYTMTSAELQANPSDVWNQRKMGWVLYYLIKEDVDSDNFTDLIKHLDELLALTLLSATNDNLIFDNVLFKLGNFVKKKIVQNDIDTPSKLSSIFNWLKNYTFNPSKGYSFLLQGYLQFGDWNEMADFFDWWNLNNLLEDDYTPFVTGNGRTLMTLAERAYIGNAKALLRLNDKERIESFLPKLDSLMTAHPEMTYPGYFYGKLLLALGSNKEEALKVIVPFARKKVSEFWVWQLLSDVYTNEPDMQLACLLRAVHCNTKEEFLGKVRIKLAALYISRNQLDRARFHIDSLVRCYISKGWHFPHEVDTWIHQPWINDVTPDTQESLDYMALTNQILCNGAIETIAIVSYFDSRSHKASLVYGLKKIMSQKLRVKVDQGSVLKVHYITESDGTPKVLLANKTNLPDNVAFAKFAEGIVEKKADKPFAFLKCNEKKYFITPHVVSKYNVQNGEKVNSLIVYDYNKSKDNWNWVCVYIKK